MFHKQGDCVWNEATLSNKDKHKLLATGHIHGKKVQTKFN